MEQSRTLFEFLVDLKEEKVKEILNEKIRSSISAESILDELQSGLVEIGNRFEKEEYFVPDLIYAGEIMKDCMRLLEPILKKTSFTTKGKVIIGTVFGDVHDLGKDVVVTMLRGSGFEVIDLGVNVPPKRFVESIKENNVKVVGMSALLTISFDYISNTVKAIENAGLRDKIFIMVGGGAVTELVCEKTGCDFYGKDALAGVKIASKVYNKG